MDVSSRSYRTAGVAALGAGAIALAPLQPLDHGATLPVALTSTHAVQLAAFDVVTQWLNVINNASLNIANLANSALGPNASNSGDGQTVGAPLPILQQTARQPAEVPDRAARYQHHLHSVLRQRRGCSQGALAG